MLQAANMRKPGARRSGGAMRGLLLITLLATFPGCTGETARVRETLLVFGSEATIEIAGVPEPAARAALAEVAAELQVLHRDWHAWEPGTLTELNAGLARGETVPLSDSLRGLVSRSLALADASGGLFDPAVGGLMALWGFHSSDFPITTPAPEAGQIEVWRQAHPSFDDLVLSEAGLSSRNPAVQLDFGAIAEGVATDHILAILRRHGVDNALIALGGDLYGIGSAGARPWRAGLRDPFNRGDQPLATVDLLDGEALYSSGTYYRYRDSPSGTRWPHIVDPRTGMPVAGIVAVNVLHPDPVLADVASTALMVAGEAGFERLLRRLGVRCALLLTEHNEIMMTAAMAVRLQMRRDPLRLGPLTGTPGPCSEPEPALP